MPGQILRTTNINRLSLANRANAIPLRDFQNISVKLSTDWDIDLNIETVDLSGIQEPDCIENQQSYDQCIISQFLQNGNNSEFSELFLCDVSQWSSKLPMVPLEIIGEYFATIMSQNVVRKCAKSCSYIQVEFDQTANRKLLKMHFGFVTLSNWLFLLIPLITPYCKLITRQPGSIKNHTYKSCINVPKKEFMFVFLTQSSHSLSASYKLEGNKYFVVKFWICIRFLFVLCTKPVKVMVSRSNNKFSCSAYGLFFREGQEQKCFT